VVTNRSGNDENDEENDIPKETPVMKALSELRLWEAEPPFAEPDDATRIEHADTKDGIIRLTDVTIPTITFYPASGRGPKPAVLVCPGGGYTILAWNHEGSDICAMLNLNGFSAFLLKYRCGCPERRAAAHADAARAMRLIRARAEEFGVLRRAGAGEIRRNPGRNQGRGRLYSLPVARKGQHG